jgi:hypothetical protein
MDQRCSPALETINLILGSLGDDGGTNSEKAMRGAAASQDMGTGATGMEEIEDSLWSVYFGPMLIGRFD